MTSGYVRLSDGCGLFWRRDGVAGRPNIILSNSLGTTHRMWDTQIERLVQSHSIIRYDTRGHGQSDAPSGEYSIDRLAHDVVELADALEIDRFDFVGLSLGGMTGMKLGTLYPDRLATLSLCNTAAYMGPPESWQARIELVRRYGMAAIADAVIERSYTPRFRASQPQEVGRILDMLLETDREGYAGCCAAIRDMDQRSSISAIRVSTLVIGGMVDPATPPEKAAEIAETIPNSQLFYLEAAHLSNIEQSKDFTAVFTRFLDDTNA